VDDLYRCADKLGNATIVEQLPQLKIEQELSTNKARSPQDVTLVTQLSFERLYMLEGQCDVWNGVISAAVYIALLNGKVVTVELNSNQDPRLTDISEVEAKFKQFHQLAEAKGERGGGCWEWGRGGAGRQPVPICTASPALCSMPPLTCHLPAAVTPTCRPVQAGPAAGVTDSGEHLAVGAVPGQRDAQPRPGQCAHRRGAAAGRRLLALCRAV
jgi:hypothetical protein